MTTKLPKEALDVQIDGDFKGTLREMIHELGCLVWEKGEGFSGKRPWGNSGWKFDVYKALILSGHIAGTLDEDGYVEEVDYQEADSLVRRLIREGG